MVDGIMICQCQLTLWYNKRLLMLHIYYTKNIKQYNKYLGYIMRIMISINKYSFYWMKIT